MARARRLLWLSAFAGIVYVLWRWRNQQAEGNAFPAYIPPPTPTPAPATPPPSGPSTALGAPGSTNATGGPRRIPTRVHRGNPPTDSAPASNEPPPTPDEPPAVALKAREVAAGAGPISQAAEPADSATLAPPAAEAAPELPVDLASSVSEAAAQTEASLSGGLVNINTADHETLVALPGIGPALARRIIAYREQHGPFGDIDQLIDVQGIGTRNIAEFRHLVTV